MTSRKCLSLLLTLLFTAALFGMTAPAAEAAVIEDGTDVLSKNVNTNNAATVYYGGNGYRVIGYDEHGIASPKGTMTLLSAGNLAQSKFGDSNHDYANSTLKTEVDKISGALTAGEQHAVVARELKSDTYEGYYTDWIAGEVVKDALMWPLSTWEAHTLAGELHVVDSENEEWAARCWWLRSPCDYSDMAAFVFAEGHVSCGSNWYDDPATEYNYIWRAYI